MVLEFDRRTTSSRERAVLEELHRIRELARTEEGPALSVLDELLPPFPLKIQIQTTTRCNARCRMCPYPEVAGEAGFEHGLMPEGLYRGVLDQLRAQPVERLSLFLMNEPLLDRRMVDWLALAREALPGATLNLFSNGSALTGELARRLREAGLDELCLSVHGFDRETYERLMEGLSFDRLMRNLEEVLEAQGAGQLEGLTIRIVSGDRPEVVRSLERADPRLRELTLRKAFSNEREAARGEGPPAEGPLCQRPFVKLYVLADGRCVLCNVDWRRSEVLGQVSDGIASIWRGERYRAVRLAHLLGRFGAGAICRGCDYPRAVDRE